MHGRQKFKVKQPVKTPTNRKCRNMGYIKGSQVHLTALATGASLLLCLFSATASEIAKPAASMSKEEDPHYTPAGFFDLHVCNWPDRKLFYMPLFSTTRYNEIDKIDVQYPDGRIITSLDLNNFMAVKRKNKPEKRVFMSQVNVPEGAEDGWYLVTVTMSDGTQITAKDYVIISSLDRVSEFNPPDGAEDIPVPKKLSWTPVKDARYYQVFIRDKWNSDKLIHSSKVLDKPELRLPDGLLEPDGLYSWKVHARDINEDPVLGDFNKGSMSRAATFSTSGD